MATETSPGPISADPESLTRWRRLRPTAKTMLRMGATGKHLHTLRVGDLEVWGNAFMLLLGNPPDLPLRDRSDEMSFRFGMKSLLASPGACPVEPLLYLELGDWRDDSLLIMGLSAPMTTFTDGSLLEHLTVNARMALFIEREVQARYGEDWIYTWRGNLSAESQSGSLPAMCAKIHPKPLTYCVRKPDGDAIVAGVLMPRTTGAGMSGHLSDKDSGLVLRYDVERRLYIQGVELAHGAER